MADRTYATLDSFLATLFEKKVAPQIQRACPGFQVIPKEALEPGQKMVNWDITSGNAGTGTAAIADGADVTDQAVDTIGSAYLPIRPYHGTFAITGLADALSKWTGNPDDLKNLEIFEMDRCMERLGVDIALDAYTGDGVGTGGNVPVVGLIAPDPSDTSKPTGSMLDSGVYANVNRASVTQFKGNVMNLATESGGQLRPDVMRKMITKIVSRDPLSRRPTVILTSAQAWDAYANIFDAQRRYDITSFRTSGGKLIELDAGTEVMTFDGIPMIRDVRIPETTTGTFLFLNLDEVKIRYVPIPTAQDMATGQILVGKSEVYSTNTGLMGKIIKLARNGDKERYAIYVYIQVQNRTPAASGYMYGINIG